MSKKVFMIEFSPAMDNTSIINFQHLSKKYKQV